MSKIRILQVLWDDDFGGAERHVYDLMSRMDRSRYENELCILHEDQDRIAKGARELGIRVHHLHLKSGFDIWGVLKFIRFARQERYDIIHSHIFPLWLMLAVGCCTRATNIVSLHGRDMVKAMRSSVLMNRISKGVVDAYISPSDVHKWKMVDIYGLRPEKVHVLYHGIDFSRFALPTPDERLKKRQELGLRDGDFGIGNIGRVTYQKNYPCFIRAAVAVHEEIPNAKFFIIGAGPDEDELRDLVKSMGAEHYIVFLGRRSDVSDLLGAWDIFMFTTRVESFGIVALEAMAKGVPVVAADNSSLPEVLGDKAVLVPTDDSDGFSREVIALLKDETRRKKMGAALRKRAEECFSLEKMVSEMTALYDSFPDRIGRPREQG